MAPIRPINARDIGGTYFRSLHAVYTETRLMLFENISKILLMQISRKVNSIFLNDLIAVRDDGEGRGSTCTYKLQGARKN